MIVALAGRRVDAPGASPLGFPATSIETVARAVRERLQADGVRAVVSSAACGADLLALREAGQLGLRRRIVLPFDRAAFRQSSVIDRPGDWGPLFDATLDDREAAGDVVTLTQTPGDAAYAAANARILDEAQALGAELNAPVTAVLVWDGISRGSGDFTAEFGAAAARRGIPVVEIRTVKTCFVIQGFGEKPDLATGRVLNLDASYDVIKEAVEEAGLRCMRADEIIHSGPIDKPMYEWLFTADVVIADLSTSNLNAVYELGVRYGLRPYTTIIVAESRFTNPFDVNHQITRFYEHLGRDVGRQEAKRFVKALAGDIRALLARTETDSPVYTFLPLQPPVLAPRPPADDLERAFAFADEEPEVTFAPAQSEGNAKGLLDKARAALQEGRFLEAKALLVRLREMRPRDPYVTQLLARAASSSESPDRVAALEEACAYLEELSPESSNDPETIGLWGDVHRQLWEATHRRDYLDRAIEAYERGFFLKQDHHNGTVLAFLLNVRANLFQEEGNRAEAIADVVLARRARRDVLRFCERAAASGAQDAEARYAIAAARWEAAAGLGDHAAADTYRAETEALAVSPAALQSTRQQIAALEKLLEGAPV